MILDDLPAPIALAPLAGGPSTPRLTAAVSEAGGLGFLATGYLGAAEAVDRIVRTRGLTGRPFGVNVFVPGTPAPSSATERYAEALTGVARQAGVDLGRPVFEDDDWDAKIAALLADPVPIVSFTFGFPGAEIVTRLKEAGSEVWLTVGTVAEATAAAEHGADVLVVQGAEAGGHRGGLDDEPGSALGTAFLDCPEAGTAPVHRDALRRAGDAEVVNLWAGQAFALTRLMPAADLVHLLAREAREALGRAAAITSRTKPD